MQYHGMTLILSLTLEIVRCRKLTLGREISQGT